MIALMIGIGLCIAGVTWMVIAMGDSYGRAGRNESKWKTVCAGYEMVIEGQRLCQLEHIRSRDSKIDLLEDAARVEERKSARLIERIEYLEAKISELEKTPGATFNVDDILKREEIIRANETI